MRALHIAMGVLAFAAGGAASFSITRAVMPGERLGGASTREGLVDATIDAVNSGDREALLDLMVGPSSDRTAATCDDENAPDAAAREKRRGELVDDALGEAKRRKLVVDHVGDDHAVVIAKRGDPIDKHCNARVEVVRHDMEIVLHDAKTTPYTAELVSIEMAGRWYLASIPQATPIDPKAVAAAPSAPPRKSQSVDPTNIPPKCGAYRKELERVAQCSGQSTKVRDGIAEARRSLDEELKTYQLFDNPGLEKIEAECQHGLTVIHDNDFGC